jgi:hypothetical protein
MKSRVLANFENVVSARSLSDDAHEGLRRGGQLISAAQGHISDGSPDETARYAESESQAVEL